MTGSEQAEGEQTAGNIDGSEPSHSSGTESEGLLTSIGMSPLIGAVIGGTVVGPIFGYGIYRWVRDQRGSSVGAKSESSDTVRAKATTDSEKQDSSSENATMDSGQRQEQATNLFTQASEAKSNGQYQQAANAYKEALNQLEQAAAGAEDEKSEFQAKIEDTQAALDTLTAIHEERDSLSSTLRAAERSFTEAIARYAAAEQTVARVRFRQARNAFKEAQQTIAESDTELLAQPIKVSFEQEATLPSLALEELAMVDESTVETLAAVDVESVTDLESDPENEAITPAVVSDLKESDEIGGEEAALLTLLSWWYEGDNREFTSEKVISRRYEQADYGFNQST